MSIKSAPFLANLFRYFLKSKYIKQLISNGSSKAYKDHGVSRFIDDFCAINDSNDFLKSLENVYAKKLELKIKHQENHASFLELVIKIEASIFVYKLFYKRNKFLFFRVQMTHLSINIQAVENSGGRNGRGVGG